jgi:hypothetical protein
MDKTCGNCRMMSSCPLAKEPKIFFDEGCTNFEGNYKYLEFQLARYQRHPFDQEKRESWPEIGKKVLAMDDDGEAWTAFIGSIGYWYTKSGQLLSSNKPKSYKIIWWCELPGEENCCD